MSITLLTVWRKALRRFGPFGIAAGGLLVMTAALALWIPQLDGQGESLRAAFETQSKAIPKAAPAASMRRIPVGQQIGEYVAEFPLLSKSPDDLKEVFLSAKRNNLQLLKGEYQFRNDAKAPLVTLTATFPISADYGSLRNFTTDVLRVIPNVSMDELRMARSSAGSTTLESSVRFSFIYRRP
jgi:hypothetical protein